jgi:hypothetical protein
MIIPSGGTNSLHKMHFQVGLRIFNSKYVSRSNGCTWRQIIPRAGIEIRFKEIGSRSEIFRLNSIISSISDTIKSPLICSKHASGRRVWALQSDVVKLANETLWTTLTSKTRFPYRRKNIEISLHAPVQRESDKQRT